MPNYLLDTTDGIIFCVKLVPNSSFSKVVDFTDDYVRIKISSPPIENRANKELIEFASKTGFRKLERLEHRTMSKTLIL